MMGLRTVFAALGATMVLAGCETFPSGTNVADYCADPNNAEEAVCQLNVEIAGQRTALAETDMRLADAQRLAEQAASSADTAQSTADDAMQQAEDAMAMANRALTEADLSCETRIIRQTDTGTCEAGYTLMSCTQTRYTYRAGGLSFLREIDDEKCRYNSRVLEMQVRCCRGAGTGEPSDVVEVGEPEDIDPVDPDPGPVPSTY